MEDDLKCQAHILFKLKENNFLPEEKESCY